MHRKICSSLPIVVILVLISAYAALAALELAGSKWLVTEIGGQPVAAAQPNREPHLAFNADGRVSGSTGCNRFTGTYNLEGACLKFSPLAMTKMACPPPLDAQERAFLQAVSGTTTVRQSGQTLELLGADGKVQMRLQAR